MKKIFLLLFPMIFLFSDCKKEDDFLFEMKYVNDFSISAGLNPFAGTHVFETNNISSKSVELFSQNNVTASEISAINPGTAVLRGIFSTPEYGYIREISIKMFSPDDPNFEKEIFYHNQISLNASGDFPLIGTLVDTKVFLEKETFGIRVELQLRDISPESIDMRLDFSFLAK